MGIIKNNIEQIQQQVFSACRRCHRSAEDVQLVAITKTIPVAHIQEAINAGIKIVGENRVQEASEKYTDIRAVVSWHLVGHLQSNKVKRALEIFEVIESVDSIHLADEIDYRAGQMQRVVQVFMEVNTSGEKSKYGVQPEDARMLAQKISLHKNIRLSGLMTVGAFLQDPEEVRPCFIMLREIRDELQKSGLTVPHLSMGMSNDFEPAIEEGATLIRIGRALFGERT
jgi:PLP dependent protein